MKKILIVEDELPIAELEKDYLELSDFEVTIETDGIEGEAKAMSGEYDLLILDVMLPGQDGFEICRKYREKYLAPVIVVSAKKEDIDKIHGLGLGADDYMTKPFSPSELVARVKAHINRYESLTEKSSEKTAKNETIEVGDLKIDRTARRVFVRGEEKNLTSKEFDLLYFLAKNPNHVFPKEELFQQIWDVGPIGGNGMVGDIATVTVHIKKIREKIEQDTSNPEYIETIWGVGYGSAPINFRDKKLKIEDTKVAGRMVCCFLYLREVRHENKKFHFNRSYDFVVVFFSIFASVDASLCTRLFFCETGIANDTISGK